MRETGNLDGYFSDARVGIVQVQKCGPIRAKAEKATHVRDVFRFEVGEATTGCENDEAVCLKEI